jgi:hypothetical protein
MSVATGPMPALDVPAAVPTFTPRVPEGPYPYDPAARDVAIAAALTRHKMAGGEPLPELPRRVSKRPGPRTAQPADWDSLVHLRGALVAWTPVARPMAPARDGERIFAGVLQAATGPRAVQAVPPAAPVEYGDPISDGGAFRDEVAAAYRALAVKHGGIPEWCPECTPSSPCKVHVVLGRRSRRAWHLADRLAACATSWDAALLLVAEGGRIAGE